MAVMFREWRMETLKCMQTWKLTAYEVVINEEIKRTHRQKDFNAVKKGEVPVELTRYVDKVIYVLYWILESKEAHAAIYPLALEKIYKRWTRCLTTMPKIILGENIVWLKTYKLVRRKNIWHLIIKKNTNYDYSIGSRDFYVILYIIQREYDRMCVINKIVIIKMNLVWGEL